MCTCRNLKDGLKVIGVEEHNIGQMHGEREVQKNKAKG